MAALTACGAPSPDAVQDPAACADAPAAAPALPACDASSAPLAEGFGEDLSWTGGCEDVVFFAANQERTVSLRAQTPALVEAADELGALGCGYALPQSEVYVQIEVGLFLPHACDTTASASAEVHCTWAATAGDVDVAIVPATDTQEARGDLTLTGVTFENALGEAAFLDELTVEGAWVGWALEAR